MIVLFGRQSLTALALDSNDNTCVGEKAKRLRNRRIG